MSEQHDVESTEEALERLKEIVLDHLGIPRPNQATHIAKLQNELLPLFVDLARQSKLVSTAYPVRSMADKSREAQPLYWLLSNSMREASSRLDELSEALFDLGVHSALEAVASSPDVGAVSALPIDDYDRRLLREAGHQDPSAVLTALLAYAAAHPHVLSDSEDELDDASRAFEMANEQIVSLAAKRSARRATAANPRSRAAVLKSKSSSASAEPSRKDKELVAKPKRLKFVAGLTKLTSGLVLLSGNGIVVPSIVLGSVMALPIFASFAAGIAAVGEGVSSFLREGE